MAVDRDKVFRWWTGRLTDAELAAATGMNLETMRWLLARQPMQAGISGGGRGRRSTRVIAPAVCTALAVAEAVRRAGITKEVAAQVVTQVPGYAERVNATIDWVPDPTNLVQYRGLDIPLDLFDVKQELQDIPLEEALDRSLMRECDPLGFWDPDTSAHVAGYLDEHLFIYDGSVVSNNGPKDARNALLWSWRGRTSSKWSKEQVIASIAAAAEQRGEHPVGRLNGDGFILWTLLDPSKIDVRTEQPNEELFRFLRKNFKTRLEINATLPVRLMKRRFYGLKVDE